MYEAHGFDASGAMGDMDYVDLTKDYLDASGKVLNLEEIKKSIARTESEMKAAAKTLDFEEAAELRDQLMKLKEMELKCRMNPSSSNPES